MTAITHLFFDIGGVLGSNGWDREQRSRATERFGLEPEFEARHAELVGDWEIGRLTLAEYLDSAVFFVARPFTREEFVSFMFAQSEPFVETIALARAVAKGRRGVRLFTLNNEADELNRERIRRFELRTVFESFLSSCWLGVRKPSRSMFVRAAAIAGADAGDIFFVDDREQNLVPARALGWDTHHFTGAALLESALRERGLL
ncbi:MAG TPA: HAD family hydrolase [Gemmatimonadaceae bacterium]|nr:HAD family hydrolase [Gemmatimonadaceae bacterium]